MLPIKWEDTDLESIADNFEKDGCQVLNISKVNCMAMRCGNTCSRNSTVLVSIALKPMSPSRTYLFHVVEAEVVLIGAATSPMSCVLCDLKKGT